MCDNEFRRIVPNDDQLFADLIRDQLNKPPRLLLLHPWLVPTMSTCQPFLRIHKPPQYREEHVVCFRLLPFPISRQIDVIDDLKNIQGAQKIISIRVVET